MKHCNKCDRDLPEEQFNKNKSHKDGLSPYCRQCDNKVGKAWRKANPVKVRGYQKAWRKTNPEKVNASNKAWQKVNSEKISEYRKRYYQANCDPEKNRARVSAWQKANPDKCKAKFARRQTKKSGAGGSYTGKEWGLLVEQYGNKCIGPGPHKGNLEADHIVPVSKGGTSNINNIQPLCKYCNCSKKDKAINYRYER